MLTLIKKTGYRFTPSGSRREVGLFRCHCGKTKEISLYNVKSGQAVSCGCERTKRIYMLGKRSGKEKASYKHGMFGTRFYSLYHGIQNRCVNNGNRKYYKDKGVKCLWKNFEDFKDDMFKSYNLHVLKFGEKQTTIDRIDSEKHYCKSNCRWATYKEQARNSVGKKELVNNIRNSSYYKMINIKKKDLEI